MSAPVVEELRESVRVKMALRKIGKQYPKTPTGKLFFAILAKAIDDLTMPRYRKEAIRYLSTNEVMACELCGVDSDWVRSVLIKLGLMYG